MGIFMENNGKLKNVLLIKAFSLSFLFVAILVVAYLLAADAVTSLVGRETGGFFAVWGAPALIAAAASLLCCALMAVFQDKIIVPVSFLFIALYYVILLVAVLATAEPDFRGIGAQMVSIYLLPPALLGNLLSWGIYLLQKRLRKRRIARRIARQGQGAAG